MDAIKISNSDAYKKAVVKAGALAASAPAVLSLLGSTGRKVKLLVGVAAVVGSLKDDLGTIFDMLKSYYKGDYKELPYNTLLKLLAGVLYFTFVVDFIPDFIPLIGLMDDAAIIAWIVKSVKGDVNHYKEWETLGERHN